VAERRCFFCGGQIGSPVYLNDNEMACMTCTIDAAKEKQREMTDGKADQDSRGC
jgi:hypothetical protein